MSEKKKTQTEDPAEGGEISSPSAEIKEVPRNEGAQARIAQRIAVQVSPVIARDLVEGKISFAALTIVVDDKYSSTFPFYPVADDEASEVEKDMSKMAMVKADMLAAIEFSRCAATFKQRAFSSL